MAKLKIFGVIGLAFLIGIFARPAEATLFVTADADLRYSDEKAKVEALGLSLRKVFADERGDRIILRPHPLQGALAIEIRKDNKEMIKLFDKLDTRGKILFGK